VADHLDGVAFTHRPIIGRARCSIAASKITAAASESTQFADGRRAALDR
jgi:hypothetical protein